SRQPSACTPFPYTTLFRSRTSESAVALARTEFRSTSQAYYFTDTWRVNKDMTLDLGIRYEYVPPWLDESGTLINAYLPSRDTGRSEEHTSELQSRSDLVCR